MESRQQQLEDPVKTLSASVLGGSAMTTRLAPAPLTQLAVASAQPMEQQPQPLILQQHYMGAAAPSFGAAPVQTYMRPPASSSQQPIVALHQQHSASELTRYPLPSIDRRFDDGYAQQLGAGPSGAAPRMCGDLGTLRAHPCQQAGPGGGDVAMRNCYYYQGSGAPAASDHHHQQQQQQAAKLQFGPTIPTGGAATVLDTNSAAAQNSQAMRLAPTGVQVNPMFRQLLPSDFVAGAFAPRPPAPTAAGSPLIAPPSGLLAAQHLQPSRSTGAVGLPGCVVQHPQLAAQIPGASSAAAAPALRRNVMTSLAARLHHIVRLRQLWSLDPTERLQVGEIMLDVLEHWVHALWGAAIERSFRRVNCPPKALENKIVTDVDFLSEIERRRAAYDAQDTGCSKEAVGSSASDGRPPATTISARTSAGPSIDATKPSVTDEASAERLKDLGLENLLLSTSSDSTAAAVASDSHKGLSITATAPIESAAQAARRQAQELSAVQLKQGLLTREVTTEDLVAVVGECGCADWNLPSSLGFRRLAARYLQVMLHSSPSLTSRTATQRAREAFNSGDVIGDEADASAAQDGTQAPDRANNSDTTRDGTSLRPWDISRLGTISNDYLLARRSAVAGPLRRRSTSDSATAHAEPDVKAVLAVTASLPPVAPLGRPLGCRIDMQNDILKVHSWQQWSKNDPTAPPASQRRRFQDMWAEMRRPGKRVLSRDLTAGLLGCAGNSAPPSTTHGAPRRRAVRTADTRPLDSDCDGDEASTNVTVATGPGSGLTASGAAMESNLLGTGSGRATSRSSRQRPSRRSSPSAHMQTGGNSCGGSSAPVSSRRTLPAQGRSSRHSSNSSSTGQ